MQKNRREFEISFIIINYFTYWLTIECIDSIKKIIKNSNYEIIVVDNDSKNESVKKIKEKFPKVKIIESDKNLGYGGAINLGVKNSKGKYIQILNSDLVFLEDYTNSFIDFYETNTDVGVLGLQLLELNGNLQNSFSYFPSALQLFLREFNLFKKWKYVSQSTKRPNVVAKADWICGAFMFVSKDNFLLIDGFDENIFLYNEEVDFCKRANLKGLKNYFFPQVKILHKHWATTTYVDDNIDEFGYDKYRVASRISTFYYMRKYFPRQHYIYKNLFKLKIVYDIVFLNIKRCFRRKKSNYILKKILTKKKILEEV